MIHKISDFCLKVDGLKKTSDRLYNLKYNNQATCLLIAKDTQPYDK